MEYNVSLTERNQLVYDKVERKLKEDNHCAIVQATGTGKSYIAMELISRNTSNKILYLAPYNSILKQLKVAMAEEGLLGDINIENMDEIDRAISIKFPNLDLKTYHWFHIHQTSMNDLNNESYDYLICDEYHHTGGEKWYLSFNDFESNHPNAKYFGMSATPQRLDGQATFFSFDNDVVNEYSLAEAIVDGVLPIPIYIDYGIRFLNQIDKNLNVIMNEFSDEKEKENLVNQIKLFIRNINSYDKLPEILKESIKKIAKYYIFVLQVIRQIKKIVQKKYMRYIN